MTPVRPRATPPARRSTSSFDLSPRSAGPDFTEASEGADPSFCQEPDPVDDQKGGRHPYWSGQDDEKFDFHREKVKQEIGVHLIHLPQVGRRITIDFIS